jgi:hypothetical protein
MGLDMVTNTRYEPYIPCHAEAATTRKYILGKLIAVSF